MPPPERVLLDARLAVRGLGIATWIDRLMSGFSGATGTRPVLWRASAGWGGTGMVGTLCRSGLFDLSPEIDPRSRGYDVVHFAGNNGSLFPGRNSVLTVQDLMHRRSKRIRPRMMGALLEKSLLRAGAVVATSSRTLQEVEVAFPQLAGRVRLIPFGLRRMPAAAGPWEHVLAFGGASDPRKRTDLMVGAYREYAQTTREPLPLVVLARAGLTPGQRTDLDDAGAVIIDDASSTQVDNLLATAAALVYPTTEEGFGLPILEAAEFGTPVVMDASARVAPEVMGDHCVRVVEPGLAAWADGLREAIGRGRVEGALNLPDWVSVAAAYQEIYEQVACR
jgi:glycosyltransferase involved in cell wall biosynthesis